MVAVYVIMTTGARQPINEHCTSGVGQSVHMCNCALQHLQIGQHNSISTAQKHH